MCGSVHSYLKWLSEDVLYLILPCEREQYQHLKTEQGCRAFIEQFWTTRGNGAKEKQYRRMAYANERYQGAKSGSNPDEGDDRTTTCAWEEWRYRHVPSMGDNIVFEFLKKDEDYELTGVRDAQQTSVLQSAPESVPPRTPTLVLVQPRVFVDGLEETVASGSRVSGPVVHLELELFGCLALSLNSSLDSSLTRAGLANGKRIDVELRGRKIRVDSGADIVVGVSTVYGRLMP